MLSLSSRLHKLKKEMNAYLNITGTQRKYLYGINKVPYHGKINMRFFFMGLGKNPPFHPLTVDGEFYVPPRRLAFEIKSLPIVLTVPNMMVWKALINFGESIKEND